MTTIITPASHGQAACDALEWVARETDRVMARLRDNNPAVEAYFARCEELRRDFAAKLAAEAEAREVE